MDFELRAAAEFDLTRIEECYLRSWRAAYEGHLETGVLSTEAEKRRGFDWSRGIAAAGAGVMVAADTDSRVLGVVQVDEGLPPPRDLPEVTMLYVDPAAWGSQVAVELLHAGEHWIASRGHTSARLRVVEEHHRARRFYEREGWGLDPDLEPARNDYFRLIYYRRSFIQ